MAGVILKAETFSGKVWGVGAVGYDTKHTGGGIYLRFRDGMDTWNGTPEPASTDPAFVAAAGYTMGPYGAYEYTTGSAGCGLSFGYQGPGEGTPYWRVQGKSYPNRDEALKAMAKCNGNPVPGGTANGKKKGNCCCCCCKEDGSTQSRAAAFAFSGVKNQWPPTYYPGNTEGSGKLVSLRAHG